MISNIGSGGATGTFGTGKSVLAKDDFMKLMITQLRYQDPLNPTEGSEFAAQLAQFSSLEQLTNLNTAMESGINANFQLTQSINNTMTAALIGKEVKLSGDNIQYNGESSITLGYTLPAEASSVTIKIYNKEGVLVKEITDAEKSQGEHKLSWNFTDNEGETVPMGEYRFEVISKNLSGDDMAVDICKYGIINSLRFTENGTRLVIGKSEYQLSDVMEIFNTTSGGK